MVKFGIRKGEKDDKQDVDEAREYSAANEIDDDDLDEEDREVFRRYREQRFNEIVASKARKTFGEVVEITGSDFVNEVTHAEPDTWVIIHLFKAGIPLCTQINRSLSELASSYTDTKFLKSISTVCIPNFPDENLPGLLIYRGGKCHKQIFGSHHFSGCEWSTEILEWIIASAGAIKSDLTEDPRKEARRRGKIAYVAADSDDE